MAGMAAQLFQQDLFSGAGVALPPGAAYAANFISELEEAHTIAAIEKLDLQPFAFHGFVGKRRTTSFGWRYDFNGGGLERAGDMPAFLEPLRERAADFAGVESRAFEHALVIEYVPGAAIGWHKDRPQFGKVVGVSLLSPCRFRFRKRVEGGWERLTFDAAPRSAYLLDGPGRWEWEHSIPPVDALRYSVTFRTMRQ